ncbi:hypothetical protein DJ72_13615 [Halorubrum distributum]|nr:hypothetical protein DJ72_13615 [Halorubrum distributum]
MHVGIAVNPVAGMGGRVGLKGTDGKVAEAVERGAEPRAPDRARRMVDRLATFPSVPCSPTRPPIPATGFTAIPTCMPDVHRAGPLSEPRPAEPLRFPRAPARPTEFKTPQQRGTGTNWCLPVGPNADGVSPPSANPSARLTGTGSLSR